MDSTIKSTNQQLSTSLLSWNNVSHLKFKLFSDTLNEKKIKTKIQYRARNSTWGQKGKERKNSPVALSAKNISPAQVPQTGFPIFTNSRREGNWSIQTITFSINYQMWSSFLHEIPKAQIGSMSKIMKYEHETPKTGQTHTKSITTTKFMFGNFYFKSSM